MITGIVGLNKQTNTIVLNSDMSTNEIKNILHQVLQAMDQNTGMRQLHIHNDARG